MKAAQVVDPAQQPDRSKVFFGAIVTLVDEEDRERIVTLVGEDETDAGNGASPGLPYRPRHPRRRSGRRAAGHAAGRGTGA